MLTINGIRFVRVPNFLILCITSDDVLSGTMLYAYPLPCPRGVTRSRNQCDRKGRIEKQGRECGSNLEEGHVVPGGFQLAEVAAHAGG